MPASDIASQLLMAAPLLVLTAPVILAAIVLVRLTSAGPGIYSQTRLGLNRRPFTIYKIRTMGNNVEARGGIRWATSRDPRVTRIGRFLRATHVDELPQLWNVLRGEMALVGPRPERPEIIAQIEPLIPGYGVRLTVLPGVTGLAQVQLPPDSSVLTASARALSRNSGSFSVTSACSGVFERARRTHAKSPFGASNVCSMGYGTERNRKVYSARR